MKKLLFIISLLVSAFALTYADVQKPVDCGDEIQIKATPAAGYHFVSWQDGNKDNPRTITAIGNLTYTATFAANLYKVELVAVNGIISVKETSINLNAVEYNTTLHFTAQANEGYKFTQWSDGNSDNPRTLTITKDTTLTAEFETEGECIIASGTFDTHNSELSWKLTCDNTIEVIGTGDVVIDDAGDVINGDYDVDLESGTAIVVDGDITQNTGTITQHIDMSTAASIIACEDNLLGSKLTVKFHIEGGVWYYLCFPFDIQFFQITFPTTRYAVYEYNGAIRAQNGSGGWIRVQGGQLDKNKGYIIQTETGGELVFDVLVPVFTCQTIGHMLPVYEAEASYDANWTLTGNPFSSYFNMGALFTAGFNSPVYTYNPQKNDYDVYMPRDDEYHFLPYEAFFVQNPNKTSTMLNWISDGRETYYQLLNNANHAPRRAAARRAQQAEEGRQFVELNLANTIQPENSDDHTRIVFNEAASEDYELGTDAVKMDGSAAIRLFTLDSEIDYAINERPAEGDIALGYNVNKDGEYILSATRLDTGIEVYDSETDQTFYLKDGAYRFYTTAGTNKTRFTIRKAPTVAVGTENIIPEDSEVEVYSITGILLHEHILKSDLQLPAGVYIIKSNNTSEKIVVL